jgi:serine protease Do
MNNKKNTLWLTGILIFAMLLSGCGVTAAATTSNPASSSQATSSTPVATLPSSQPSGSSSSLLGDYQSTLENIYQQVSPSVVYILVTLPASTSSSPFGSSGAQQASGSGFVWDMNGNIVTNNHVVAGATQVTVTFMDGTTVPATIVGTDPASDLAVINVKVDQSILHPVQLADSETLKVGQVVIAIGNPFGLVGTMTSGIVSALGRFLPTTSGTSSGYTIPDVIQTDAAINPGNSGGVLVDTNGMVVGVTNSIESSTNSSAGVGFAIPSNIVNKVVPVLISTGSYQHPYLGLSGTDMNPDIAQAMNLPTDTLGALVVTVTANGPAAKAGIQGSTKTATIAGTQVQVGGDVIIAINGSPIKSFNDLVDYILVETNVGQTITMTIIRNGNQMDVQITLEARPSSSGSTSISGGAFLGITGVTVNAAIDQAMGLPSNVPGVLVESVQSGSPAADAGLQGGTQSTTISGQNVTIGGDIIIGYDQLQVTSLADLQSYLSQSQPGQDVVLTIIRNGQETTVHVILGQSPTSG